MSDQTTIDDTALPHAGVGEVCHARGPVRQGIKADSRAGFQLVGADGLICQGAIVALYQANIRDCFVKAGGDVRQFGVNLVGRKRHRRVADLVVCKIICWRVGGRLGHVFSPPENSSPIIVVHCRKYQAVTYDNVD